MPEYSEESWRCEETCCHLDSSEKPPANTGVKNLQVVKKGNVWFLFSYILSLFLTSIFFHLFIFNCFFFTMKIATRSGHHSRTVSLKVYFSLLFYLFLAVVKQQPKPAAIEKATKN